MTSENDYISRAEVRLAEVLNSELALVKPEAIARLAEAYNADDHRNFDSHIVGHAIQALDDKGILIRRTAVSKGGHAITTLEPANQRKRSTDIGAAAMRKRALYARYLGWAQGTERFREGLLGPAGEAATRAAIVSSAALQPALPGAAAVSTLLGVRLPGPADSAGYMNPIIDGLPGPPVTVLFEVKNIREWIYPSSSELFQLLEKGNILQRTHPTRLIVPILICRAAHKTAFWMASQLGFLIIDMRAQFVGTRIDEEPFLEVRNELFFTDLYLGDGPSLRVRDRLTKHIPKTIQPSAEKWAVTAASEPLSDLFTTLRSNRLPPAARNEYMSALRDLNKKLGRSGGW